MDMELNVITQKELKNYLTTQYGQNNHDISFESTVVIANLIRRIASFQCPCQRNEIISIITDSYKGLVEESIIIREKAKKILEDLIEYGDIIEIIDVDNDKQKVNLLYLSPPIFVPIENNRALIIGIAPNQIDTLPDELEDRVKYNGHYRIIDQEDNENLYPILSDFGLIKYSFKKWSKSPTNTNPEECFKAYSERLSNSGLLIENRDVDILDPATNQGYYHDRWKALNKQTGVYVAKRPIQYRNKIFSIVNVEEGQIIKAIDLPILTSHRGCDEAWYLQCAIDCLCNNPQQYSIESNAELSIIKLFFPIPRWIKRRMDIRLRSIDRKGCLMAFEGLKDDVNECQQILENDLWIQNKNQ